METQKFLLIHNFYQQSGGEDRVFSSLSKLLSGHGHHVVEYLDDNARISGMNPISLARQTLWSQASRKNIEKIIQAETPGIVHCHNIFPLISPSIYYACHDAGVAVVQSLDNPRLLCPSANFYRNGRLCMDCTNQIAPWPSVMHACYRKSRVQTSVVAAMLVMHRIIGTWREMIDGYLVATEFYRKLFISFGFPSEKLFVRPHFVFEVPIRKTTVNQGTYALFMARLDPEKGVQTMLEAWKNLDIPLKIRGGGLLESEIHEYILEHPQKDIEIIGRLGDIELLELVKNARFLIWPSEGYYETFGMAAIESYACGVPVIASRIGVMTEIVHDGLTGILFNPGDPQDLALKVNWLWNHPNECERMGQNARLEYEEKYSDERYYQKMMGIYSKIKDSR